ncbi:hypothetical protein J6590_037354 [Homalodisca vitripennis]|nr:hypothetical protein J6590_037354 [Homalodisca vitripennis]
MPKFNDVADATGGYRINLDIVTTNFNERHVLIKSVKLNNALPSSMETNRSSIFERQAKWLLVQQPHYPAREYCSRANDTNMR